MAFDIDLLRDFTAVVEDGGFASASRARRIPRSTLSKRVMDLEASLGVRLIERTTRSMRLTEDGARLHEHALRIVAEADEAERSIRDRLAEPKGHIRVSAPVLFGTVFGGQLAAAYTARWPGTSLDLVLADRRIDLVEDGFDLAIRTGRLDQPGLMRRQIATARQWLVASRAVAARFDPLDGPAALADTDCIQMGVRDGTGSSFWRLECEGEAMEVLVTGPLMLSSLLMAREAAISGAGVAFLPSFILADAISEGTLVRVCPEWASAPVEINAVFPSRRFLSQRVRAFIDLLVEHFPDASLEREV